MALSDDYTRASPIYQHATSRDHYSGSGVGWRGSGLRHAGGSSQWRAYARFLGFCIPWLILAAIFVGAFCLHGVVDTTVYPPAPSAQAR